MPWPHTPLAVNRQNGLLLALFCYCLCVFMCLQCVCVCARVWHWWMSNLFKLYNYRHHKRPREYSKKKVKSTSIIFFCCCSYTVGRVTTSCRWLSAIRFFARFISPCILLRSRVARSLTPPQPQIIYLWCYKRKIGGYMLSMQSGGRMCGYTYSPPSFSLFFQTDTTLFSHMN